MAIQNQESYPDMQHVSKTCDGDVMAIQVTPIIIYEGIKGITQEDVVNNEVIKRISQEGVAGGYICCIAPISLVRQIFNFVRRRKRNIQICMSADKKYSSLYVSR